MDAKLLDMLACPACKKPLEYKKAPESLDCAACGKSYRFEDGVPVLLVPKP
ncbi:MAG: Trm112 family protein [Elusimicrobiota bacterium]